MIVRDEQLIVLYLFDRKKEISKNDTNIECDTQLGRGMTFDDKLAL